jgi:flagellin-like hook-associated protein FlgL
LDELGGENNMGSYKLAPQARFLADQMEQMEKRLLDSIAKLSEHLQSLETMVDKFAGDLGAVQSKVDLAMASINLVQQELV